MICENGTQCQQSEISRMTGISRQTINSAIRKLQQDDIVTVRQGQGRNTIVSLTESGQAFAARRIHRSLRSKTGYGMNGRRRNSQQYLRLTQMYRDGLRRYMDLLPSLASRRNNRMNRENKRKQYEKGYYKTHGCSDSFVCKVCGRLVVVRRRRQQPPQPLPLLPEQSASGQRNRRPGGGLRRHHGPHRCMGAKKRRVGDHPPLPQVRASELQTGWPPMTTQ